MWEPVKAWFFSLGPKYGVNPSIFGSIYVGAIPFFTAVDRVADPQSPAKEIDRGAAAGGVILLSLGLPLPDHRGQEHTGMGVRFSWRY